MSRVCLGVALACALAGCAPDEEIPGSGHDVRVDPTGEQNRGYFVAKVPPSPRGYYENLLFYWNGGGHIAPNTQYRVMAAPWSCLEMLRPNGPDALEKCDIPIQVGATTTVELGWLHWHWDPAAFVVDFGPTVAWPYISKDDEDLGLPTAGYEAHKADPPQSFIMLPGDYVFDFRVSALPPTRVTLHPNEGLDVDLTAEVRSTIHVVPPAREYPDSPCAGAHVMLISVKLKA